MATSYKAAIEAAARSCGSIRLANTRAVLASFISDLFEANEVKVQNDIERKLKALHEQGVVAHG